MEARVPGLGGFFFDQAGVAVVYLKDPVDLGGFRTHLASFVEANRGRFNAQRSAVTRVEVRQAQFSFSELVTWQGRLSSVAKDLGSFATIDADETANRVHLTVPAATPRAAISAVLQKAAIPPKAVTVSFFKGGMSLDGGLRGTYRPTAGGIQIKPDYESNANWVCTLGYNVTAGDGLSYFLTASHCADAYLNRDLWQSPPTGESWYQPCCSSGNKLGVITINQPWNDTAYPCTVTNCTSADAMLVKYDAGISSPKKIAKTSAIGTGNNIGNYDNVVGYLTVNSITAPWPLTVVSKIGRTTGWTAGPITQTCINWYATVHGQQIEETCVQEVQARAEGGDSGAPVFEYICCSTAAAQGIEFGSYIPGVGENWLFYYVAWAPIQTRLGTSLTPY
jgi:hypothetical protein